MTQTLTLSLAGTSGSINGPFIVTLTATVPLAGTSQLQFALSETNGTEQASLGAFAALSTFGFTPTQQSLSSDGLTFTLTAVQDQIWIGLKIQAKDTTNGNVTSNIVTMAVNQVYSDVSVPIFTGTQTVIGTLGRDPFTTNIGAWWVTGNSVPSGTPPHVGTTQSGGTSGVTFTNHTFAGTGLTMTFSLPGVPITGAGQQGTLWLASQDSLGWTPPIAALTFIPETSMAWTLVSDTTFSGASSTSTPGALGTLYNGWVDQVGAFSINSSGQLQTSYTGSLASAATSGILYRPSSEKALNHQVVMRFTHVSGVFPNVVLAFNRATGNPPYTSGEAYGLNAATTGTNWGRWNATAGTFTGVNNSNGTAFTALTVGNTYDLVVQFVQTTGVTGRTMSGSIYTVTNPATDALMSGTQAGVFSLGGSITTPGLNYVDAVTGVFFSTGAISNTNNSTPPSNGAGATSGIILRIATYNDAGGIPLTIQELSGLTFTGPATGIVGSASSTFSVTPTSITFAFTTIVTPNDGGLGGTFTPTSLSFAAAATAAQTFTYTPATTNSGTPIPINLTASSSNPSSVMPAAVPITVSSAASSYTLTGPTAGTTGVASTNFTVTPNSTVGSNIIVTPSASPAAGTFTPTTVTFTSGTATPQTFTYTPASATTETISTTNNGSLTNPSSVTYVSAAAATTLTLTGPTSGTVGVASTNFTVTPNAGLGAATTVTPASSPVEGTFTPSSLSFAAGSSTPQTFTYTPAASGTKSVSITNNQSLTNSGSPINYVASSGYSLTGPSGGVNGVASTNFSVTPTGTGFGSTTVVTPNDSSGGGSFAPTALTFTSGSTTPQTFTYTPTTATTQTIGTTNNQGVTNPASLSYVVTAAATSYTFTGPSTGFTGTASTNFTVTPNSTVAANVTITPASIPSTGSFSPTTVTFSAGSAAAQTFTYTPTSATVITLSTTNSASLTNPSSLSYTASAATGGVITCDNAAFLFSPLNWHGNANRVLGGASGYAESVYSGAWFEFTFNASSSPTCVLNFATRTTSSFFTLFVNDVRVALRVTVPSGNYTVASGITASATNTIKFFIAGSTQSNGWFTPTNTVRLNSITIDAASSPVAARALNPYFVFDGDSITEGIYANSGSHDNLSEWSYLVGQGLRSLGYDYCIRAFGSNGYRTYGWNGDVPPLYYVNNGAYSTTNTGVFGSNASSRWHLVSNGVSALDTNGRLSAYGGTGQEPFAILNFMGTNDGNDFRSIGTGPDGQTTGAQGNIDLNTALRGNGGSIPGYWGAMRTAAPSAYLFQFATFCAYNLTVSPFGTLLHTSYTNLASDRSSDAKFAYCDTGPALTAILTTGGGGNGVFLASGNGSHPILAGSALIAPAVMGAIAKKIGTTGVSNRWAHF